MATAATRAGTATKPSTKEYKVEFRGEKDWEYKDAMIPVLEGFAKKIKKNVLCINPHGELFDAPTDKDTFHLIFWSAPTSPASNTPSNNMGFETFWGNPQWNPGFVSALFANDAEHGVPLTDSGGNIWGALSADNVAYFYYDLPHMKDAGEILTHSINNILEVSNSGVSLEDMLTEIKRKKAEQKKNQFIEACKIRDKASLQQLESSLSAAVQSVESSRNQLIQNLAQVNTLSAQMEAEQIRQSRIRKGKGDVWAKFEGEWNALLDNSKVADVDFANDKIIVTTTKLISKWLSDGTRREFGQYRITFDTKTGADPIIKNLNSKDPEGYDHPHIHGSVCWGNMSTIIAELAAAFEYAAMTQIIIKFLEEPNVTDAWGVRTWVWPIAEKKKNAKPRGEAQYIDSDYEDGEEEG